MNSSLETTLIDFLRESFKVLRGAGRYTGSEWIIVAWSGIVFRSDFCYFRLGFAVSGFLILIFASFLDLYRRSCNRNDGWSYP